MPKHHRALAVFAAFALASCGTEGTQPSGVIATGGPLLDLFDPPVQVTMLQRSKPLLHSFAAAAVIGPEGGTIRIPEAGFSIAFPAGAVAAPTPIAVTAVPGSSVAYLFQPHGLVFASPAVITQDLRGTLVPRDPYVLRQMEGAYFTGLEALAGLTATVRETRPTLLDVDARKLTWTVEHFSGYTASYGRRGGYINASGNLIPTSH